MEVVYTKKLPTLFNSEEVNALYGDVMHLINMGIDIEGIDYDDNWTVKRFLNGYHLKISKRLEGIFNYLELDMNILSKRLSDLSKTNFKFVLLAYLLINNIKIIIFDYFDVGLSHKERKKLARIIKSMKKDGITVIFISKDLAFMDQFCDNITVIYEGDIAYSGSIKEIHNHLDVLTDIPEIFDFIELANSKGARLDYTLDSKELLKDIYRSVY